MATDETTQEKLDWVYAMRGRCRLNDLDGLAAVETFSNRELARMTNGIGPDWMPSAARKVLDGLYSLLQPAAFIHDVRYSTSDGTDDFFDRANDELERNGKKLANAEYGWYNPMRYVWRHRAAVIAEACRIWGHYAYKSAYTARQNSLNIGQNSK